MVGVVTMNEFHVVLLYKVGNCTPVCVRERTLSMHPGAYHTGSGHHWSVLTRLVVPVPDWRCRFMEWFTLQMYVSSNPFENTLTVEKLSNRIQM